MPIHIIQQKATPQEMIEMLNVLGDYIKIAVDIEREILAGGGQLHADCEAELLKDGSQQEDIWGADWVPNIQEVKFESLINIRPNQNNRSMIIQDPKIKKQVEIITRKLLEGVK
ncbi:MAG: DUF5674 family protein [Planctomycetota bacterium]